MKRYLKYIKPYLLFFTCGPVLMLSEVGGEVLMPYLMAKIIKNGIANSDYGYVTALGLGMVGISIVMMICGIGGNYCSAKAATGFAMGLRRDAFAKVQTFSFNNIDKFSTGSLVTRLTNDVTQLQNIIRMALIMLLRAPGMLIGATIMAMAMNASLAMIILAMIPVLIVVIIVMIRIAFPRFNKMQKRIDTLNSDIRENLTNVRVVKSFVRGRFEEKKFEQANNDLQETSLSAFNIMIFAMPIMSLATSITTIAVVWVGGRQVMVGDMNVADLTAFTNYIMQILMSLMLVAMILLNSSRAIASAS